MVFRKRDLYSVSTESTRTESSYNKPLPLKQRTSSSTDRRDFTSNTWISLLQLIKFREYLVPVNHFSIWRRHNAWAFEDGKDLRSYIGNRYASNMVFMSLLLSTEFGVLFNSSAIAGQVRDDLVEAQWGTVSFWAGLFIIISSLFTILSLISTFTFTAMISAIDEVNAHCVLRSSIGQYATELPGRLIVCSIYTFLVSFKLFFFILLPVGTFSILLLLGTIFLFVHVVSVFSSFGRIIMHTGAMGKGRIFSSEYEELLVPDSLHGHLLSKAKCNLAHKISIKRQYRHKQRAIDRFLLEEEYYDHLSGTPKSYLDTNFFGRFRADSKVRFADEESGLADNHKEVIEGKIDEVAGGSRHHFRSLTPLSDISDHSRQPMGQINGIRSTIDGDLSSLAVPPKKFFVNSDRTREISDISSSAVNSLQNVSTSSLEQWLQGSNSDIGANVGKESNTTTTSTTRLKNTIDGDFKDEKKDAEANGLPPVVPPPAASVVANTSKASTSTNRKVKPIDTSVIINREKGHSLTMEFLDSEGLRVQRANERDMSEEERFLFDYGDFVSDKGRGRTKNHAVYGTNSQLNNHDQIEKDESDGNHSATENERTRLLE